MKWSTLPAPSWHLVKSVTRKDPTGAETTNMRHHLQGFRQALEESSGHLLWKSLFSSQRWWSITRQGRTCALPDTRSSLRIVMSRQGPRKGPRRRAPTGHPHAGLTTCLRCDQEFWSWDRRQNRLCATCHEAIDADSSDEDDYPFHAPWRRLHPEDS